MKKAILSICVFAVLLLCVQVGHAAANISGSVLDSDSEPLAGVVMSLYDGSTTRIVTSKFNGTFGFVGAPNAFYVLTPLLANYTFSPTSRSFFLSGSASGLNFTGTLGTLTASPLDTPEFFVRQQYLDLLLREPDEEGLSFWTGALKACSTQACRFAERHHVLCAFVASGEYQARFTGTSVTVCE